MYVLEFSRISYCDRKLLWSLVNLDLGMSGGEDETEGLF